MTKKTKLIIASTIIVIIAIITIIITSSIGLKTDTNSENVSEITSEAVSEEIAEENVVEETTEDNIPVIETTTKRAINNKEISVHLDDEKVSELCGENDDNSSSSEDRLSKEKAKADALADAKAEEIMPKEAEEQDEGFVPNAFVSIKTENPTYKAGKYGNNSTTTTTVVENENNVLVED